MVYRFLLLSDEVEEFKREITIDSDATFLDLQNAILDSVGYAKDQMTSFFVCGDDWSRQVEVTLIEMDTNSEEDSYIMNETHLYDLLEEEKQKLMFVFDSLMDRVFFMELREIITGKNQAKAICTKSVGTPPVQLSSIEDMNSISTEATGLEENFYGDEEFDIDELDSDGFEGLDGPATNPYDDSY